MHRRGPWSQQEDTSLLQLVQVHGPHNWVRISQLVGSRSPKQCRERYHQNLKPTLNHEPITPEEGVVIERLVGEMGKRWAEIARRLHGRSDNAVKNWWNGGMNRRRRLGLRPRADAHEECEVAESIEEHEETPQTPYAVSVPSSPNAFSNALRSINSTLIPRDDPLTSPSLRSEFSRGQTPSLISDSASQLSVSSPRLPPSPGDVSSLTLPPLMGHHDSRMSNLPARSAQSLPEFRRPPSFFGFHHADRGRFSTSALRGPMESSSSSSSSSTLPYSYLRSKPAPPPTTLFDAQTVRKESRRKDSRMNLANICI